MIIATITSSSAIVYEQTKKQRTELNRFKCPLQELLTTKHLT